MTPKKDVGCGPIVVMFFLIFGKAIAVVFIAFLIIMALIKYIAT